MNKRTIVQIYAIIIGLSLLFSAFLVINGVPFLCRSISLVDSILVEDEHSYGISFDIERRKYVENQTAHRVHVVALDLVNEEHNLTLGLETEEKILSFYPSEAKNYTIGNSKYVSFLFKGTQVDNLVFLEKEECYPDPLDVEINPSDLNLLPAGEDNSVDFELILNVSEQLERVDIDIGSVYDRNIMDYKLQTSLNLTYEDFWRGKLSLIFSNVSVGCHLIRLKVQLAGIEGDFPINIEGYQSQRTTFPVRVILDGKEINFDKRVIYNKNIDSVSYLVAREPQLYGYSSAQTYNLTFLSDENLRFRVDPLSRERLEFLIIQGQIENFTVAKCDVQGYDAYFFDVKLNSVSNVSLGISLYDKKWFLRPSIMTFQDIPEEISDEYVRPRPSEFIDSDNDYVKLWNRQVVGNESNPLLVAYLIYENLTKTLEYDENYKEFAAINETASATLRNRAGVCRHFSRAFAALGIVSGLPVRTVIGTAFNLERDPTTLKKNHAWNEIYLPKFGWVPVDVTWKDFGVLSNAHAIITYWEYKDSSLNISRIDSPEAQEAAERSRPSLRELVDICRSKVKMSSLENSEQILILLDEASLLAEYGNVQDTLLTLLQTYSLMPQTQPQNNQWLLIVLVFLIAIPIAMISYFGLRRLLARIRRAP